MQDRKKTPAVVALGMFDGVHLGHRALLRRAVETAKELGAQSVAYTFSNHPRSVFAQAPKLLSTEEERRGCIKRLGLDRVQMEAFDKETAMLSPEAFVNRLREQYDVRAFVVGFNYTFGQGGRGTPEMLEALGKAHGFQVHIIPPVLFKGDTVSSTRIRQLVTTGGLADANSMLTEPYALTGPVVKNRRIGTSLGFPTANIRPPAEKALPATGIYVTSTLHGGRCYESVTNVGTNPTVNGSALSVETYLMDYTGDLYGKELTVRFHKRLRDEIRFASKEELVLQIRRDVTDARTYFQNPGDTEKG
ncbi:MAG TPA: bifunctional riboflavin kinase/FAD synthetase [Feifaniaceae bacterium]|nr:bifunctional riboflavin kinase/FAD synthetase [Feifaniaceae bacterium]